MIFLPMSVWRGKVPPKPRPSVGPCNASAACRQADVLFVGVPIVGRAEHAAVFLVGPAAVIDAVVTVVLVDGYLVNRVGKHGFGEEVDFLDTGLNVFLHFGYVSFSGTRVPVCVG